jgi:23S rRNA (pseudouridine1915-N3)-methyltransferase
MKIALVQIGKTTDSGVINVADQYSNRIRKFITFDIVTIPDIKNTKSMPVSEQKTREGEKILREVNPDDYLILLDEHGQEMRTMEFSAVLQKLFHLPRKRLVFVIGGPWGFSDEAYKRADYRLSLSKMTFPHQLVRLLFLEQLYRAFTIIKGDPYHHE